MANQTKYETYEQVPTYRKQWFFWIFTPVAVGILLFGDIYYQGKDGVKCFGIANRVMAGIIGIGLAIKMFNAAFGG